MEIKLLRDYEKRRFFHTLPGLMMNDKTAVAVQYAAKIIKGAADIQVSFKWYSLFSISETFMK